MVFNLVHTDCRNAHNADQHITLVVHQMHQQIHRRAQQRAPLDGIAQAVDGAQGLQPSTDHQPWADRKPHGGDVGGLKRKVVVHLVDYRHKHVVVQLHAGGLRADLERFMEHVRQLQVVAQPLFGRAVRQVEVQPDKARARAGQGNVLGQPLQRLPRVERLTPAVGSEVKATDQPI